MLGELFAGASQLFLDCGELEDTEFNDLVWRALSNRCRTAAARGRVCKFAQDYLEFPLYRDVALPFYGGQAIPTVVSWLDHIRLRGETVPHLGRYCLMAFGEAVGICFSVDHPAVRAAAATHHARVVKSAPGVPYDFVVKLEHCAADTARPDGMQLAAALFSLMTFAPLRFVDRKDVLEFWISETAVCGRSLDHKDKAGPLMSWAAPKCGILSEGGWISPILSFWNTMTGNNVSCRGSTEYQFLFHCITKDWEIDFFRAGTHGAVLACLRNLEKTLGFNTGCTLHSFRARYATCANQLAFKREDRGKLGRWAAGSVMPDRYDRATCATELRLRNEVVAQVLDGWRPQVAFEVPTKPGGSRNGGTMAGDKQESESECESASSTSTASHLKPEIKISEL